VVQKQTADPIHARNAAIYPCQNSATANARSVLKRRPVVSGAVLPAEQHLIVVERMEWPAGRQKDMIEAVTAYDPCISGEETGSRRTVKSFRTNRKESDE
jgi:hypothetical protein